MDFPNKGLYGLRGWFAIAFVQIEWFQYHAAIALLEEVLFQVKGLSVTINGLFVEYVCAMTQHHMHKIMPTHGKY